MRIWLFWFSFGNVFLSVSSRETDRKTSHQSDSRIFTQSAFQLSYEHTNQIQGFLHNQRFNCLNKKLPCLFTFFYFRTLEWFFSRVRYFLKWVEIGFSCSFPVPVPFLSRSRCQKDKWKSTLKNNNEAARKAFSVQGVTKQGHSNTEKTYQKWNLKEKSPN